MSAPEPPPIPTQRNALIEELRRTTNTRAARLADRELAAARVEALDRRIADLLDALWDTPAGEEAAA